MQAGWSFVKCSLSYLSDYFKWWISKWIFTGSWWRKSHAACLCNKSYENFYQKQCTKYY